VLRAPPDGAAACRPRACAARVIRACAAALRRVARGAVRASVQERARCGRRHQAASARACGDRSVRSRRAGCRQSRGRRGHRPLREDRASGVRRSAHGQVRRADAPAARPPRSASRAGLERVEGDRGSRRGSQSPQAGGSARSSAPARRSPRSDRWNTRLAGCHRQPRGCRNRALMSPRSSWCLDRASIPGAIARAISG